MSDRVPRRPRVATSLIVGVLAVVALVLGGLHFSGAFDDARGGDEAASPQEYAAIALDHMRDGIHADPTRYDEVRSRVEREVVAAESYEDTYLSLTRAGEELGGEHTYFIRPVAAASMFGDSETSTRNFGVVPTVRTSDGTTTVTVPSFGSPNPEIRQEYVDRGAQAIVDAAPATTRGWVVDLRSNNGGAIWPMLAAVSSLLDEGPVLAFEGRNSSEQATVQGGAAALDGTVLAESTVERFETDLPVAVVIGQRTVSAGEAVAIAFVGQEGVRVFGQPSYGFTSANEARTLSDGAVLNLTTAFDADRSGRLYKGPIQPDEVVDDEQLPDAIFDWLTVAG